MKEFSIPYVAPSTNKSVRFPNSLVKEVEEAIEGKESTFAAFVVEATKMALEMLKEQQKRLT